MSEATPPLSDRQLDGVLPLAYEVLLEENDKRDALRLVADSIAQQRQVASAAVIFHPMCLAVLAGMCAVAYRQFQYQGLGTVTTMVCGVVIMYLATVRYFTSPYIQMAEAFRWKSWITGPGGKEDMVIAAKFGKEIIATLVLRLQSHVKSDNGSEPGEGIVRAWTTKLRYRQRGVGSDLLQFAVHKTQEEFGPGARVEFAPDHANSVHPLYDMFSKSFQRRQKRASQALTCALIS